MYLVKIFLILFIFEASLLAQEAYKWKDSQGRVVYGTKPPSSIKDPDKIESIKLRKLSTYSENRVLKHLGKEPLEKVKTPEFNISKKVENGDKSSKSLIDQTSRDKGSVSKTRTNVTRTNVSEVMLKSEVPVISKNDKGLITACKVEIVNITDKQAFEISVAFEFPDGTLIPATGPFELDAGAKAEFFIPNELLPIEEKLGTDLGDASTGESQKNQALPKVIIHSLGS